MQYVLGVMGNGAIGLHTLHRKPNSLRPTAGITFSVKEIACSVLPRGWRLTTCPKHTETREIQTDLCTLWV